MSAGTQARAASKGPKGARTVARGSLDESSRVEVFDVGAPECRVGVHARAGYLDDGALLQEIFVVQECVFLYPACVYVVGFQAECLSVG